MSEIKLNRENVILVGNLIEFLDRNNLNTVVRTTNGIEFKKNKTETPKHKNELKDILKNALSRIDDHTEYNRQGRLLVKQVMDEL